MQCSIDSQACVLCPQATIARREEEHMISLQPLKPTLSAGFKGHNYPNHCVTFEQPHAAGARLKEEHMTGLQHGLRALPVMI